MRIEYRMCISYIYTLVLDGTVENMTWTLFDLV